MWVYLYVESQKQYFEQKKKKGQTQNDIFNITIYMKFKAQYFRILIDV